MPPRPRIVGRVNWYGAYTLYKREVWRFLKTPTRSIFAPTVSSLLFLAVFSLALGNTLRSMGGVPLIQFLAPGLMVMAIFNAAFENTAGSLVQGKLLGNIADMLVPPLSAAEITTAIVLGGATRGVVTGLVLWVVMTPFIVLAPVHGGYVLFYALGAALLPALLGVLAGLWATKWDHLAAVINFTVMPLMFLSGTFYSIERLPESWRAFARANPLFYVIDGFRYGFTGHADSGLAAGMAVVVLLTLAIWALAQRLIAIGYKIKS